MNPLSPTNQAPTTNPQPAPQPARSNRSVLTMLVWPVVAVLVVAGVYYWQHKKVNDLNVKVTNLTSQLSTSSAQAAGSQKALAALPNTVKDTTGSGSTIDLSLSLGANNTGCYKNTDTPIGWFQIVKETNDAFAKMQYGCVSPTQTTPTGTATYLLAKKTSTAWQTISPTNQWVTVSGATYPTCTMLNDNKFTKQIEPKCATGTTANGQTTYTVQDNANL